MTQVTFVNGKYVATINGKTVKRTKKEHMDYVLRKAGMQANAVEASAPQESRFSINERFGFVGDMVTMLCKGAQPSVIITGPGGLGKSYTVTKTLEANGFKDMSILDDSFEVGTKTAKNKFVVVKGYSTPKGLYRTLYENRNSVIVFDDCDSVLKDPVSLNLLKAALDSYSRRIISWRADIKDEDLPTVFEFKGRVVFISNLSSASLDQAIITRSLAVDLTMTAKQKVERMRFLLTQPDFMEDFVMVHKTEAMDLVDSLCDNIKELSLRTLMQVIKIRKSNPNGKWKDLAEYAICG